MKRISLFFTFVFLQISQIAYNQEFTKYVDKRWVAALDARDWGNSVLALAKFNEAIALDPKRGDLYNSRAKTYFDMAMSGMYPSETDSLLNLAIQDYTTGLRCRPLKKMTRSELLANRGGAYGVKGQYTLAIRDFSESIRVDPNNKNSYFNRSICYFNLRQYDKCIADYGKYLRLDPDNYNIIYERGMLQRVLHQNEKAIEDLNRAIELSPNFGLAFLERARAYAQAGDKTSARRDYEAARILGIQLTVLDAELLK